MNPRIPVAVLLVAASLAGCTHSSNQSLNLPLTATYRNQGQAGTTTLTGVDKQTNFDFYISGVPSGTILPPRIYTFVNKGSCQQPGTVAYAMNDKVNVQSAAGAKGWSFYRSAPIAIADMISRKYSIVVRSAPEDGNFDLFCGDVVKTTQ
jgi:hypothetical protein